MNTWIHSRIYSKQSKVDDKLIVEIEKTSKTKLNAGVFHKHKLFYDGRTSISCWNDKREEPFLVKTLGDRVSKWEEKKHLGKNEKGWETTKIGS